jgi:hypothetical protein
MRDLTLFLNDLTSETGVIAQVDVTTETVLTQQEKLDLMTVTQDVNLDTMESDTAANTTAVGEMQSASPNNAIANDGTLRSFNADAAAGTISVSPTQAEVERNQSAILVNADVLATLIRDLIGKGMLS